MCFHSPEIEDHVKVKELRELVLWSEGHIWCAPELHGSFYVLICYLSRN